MPVQLLIYVWNILKGDFGYSFSFKQPVLGVILDRVPATVLLMLMALLLLHNPGGDLRRHLLKKAVFKDR